MTAGAHEQSHAVGVQELVRRVDRVVDNLGFGRGLQQAPTKSLQGGVVRGLKRQAVEGPGILQGHGGLGAERREKLHIRSGERPRLAIEDRQRPEHLAALREEGNGENGGQLFSRQPHPDMGREA